MTTVNQSQPLPEEAKMLAADYVLGALSPEEVARLEQMAEAHLELRQEINALQTSLALMPQALTTVAPPASLRAKIVAGEASASAASLSATPDPSSEPPFGIARSQRFSPAAPRSARPLFKIRVFKILAGIAALAALLLAVDNLRLRNRLQLAEQVDPDRVAAILQQPNSRLIALNGLNGEGGENDPTGTLLFTPGKWQEVIVSLGNLPSLPPDEVYRMWLALDNGEVIYCGEFDAGNDGSVYVRFTPLETPPKGVKTTELLVTIDASGPIPDSSGERVMQGAI